MSKDLQTLVIDHGGVILLRGAGGDTKELLRAAAQVLGLPDGDIPAIAKLPGTAVTLAEAAEQLAEAVLAPDFRKNAAAMLLAGEVKVSSDVEKLRGRLADRRKEIEDFPSAIVQRVLDQKSSSKGCGNCKAAIPVKHVLAEHGKTVVEHFGLNCPVCGDADFLITDGDKARLAKLREDVVDLEARLVEAERKAVEKAGGTWIVAAAGDSVPNDIIDQAITLEVALAAEYAPMELTAEEVKAIRGDAGSEEAA